MRSVRLLVPAAGALVVGLAAPGQAEPPRTERISAGASAAPVVLNDCAPSPAPAPNPPPNPPPPPFAGSLVRPAISGDGDVVVFRSNAAGLVPGVPGGVEKVYARTRSTGTTVLVSVAADGGLPDGPSQGVSVSKDGRVVAFSSCATNLLAEPQAKQHTYVRDLVTGRTELVSRTSAGVPGPGFIEGQPTSGETALSDDGRYVALVSTAGLVRAAAPGVQQVYVRDRLAGTTVLASSDDAGPGAGHSDRPAISSNGRVVAFESVAALAGDVNPGLDVFVRDLRAQRTEVVAVDGTGRQVAGTVSNRPTLSASGRYVAFRSSARLAADDLNSPPTGAGSFDAYVRDRWTGTTVLVSVDAGGRQAARPTDVQGPSIDGSGHRVAFYTASALDPADGNGLVDVYVRDWTAGRTSLVSRTAAGEVPATAPAGRSFDPVLAADAPLVVTTSSFRLTPDDTDALQDTYVSRLD